MSEMCEICEISDAALEAKEDAFDAWNDLLVALDNRGHYDDNEIAQFVDAVTAATMRWVAASI